MRLVRYTQPNHRFAATPFGFTPTPWTGLENEIGRFLEAASPRQFPVDIFEDKENTYVRAELPGISRESVNVELVNGELKLTASRKVKTGDNEENFSFSRSLSVPDDVQADKIAAALENGVLTVTLPKREEVKPKKISVEVR